MKNLYDKEFSITDPVARDHLIFTAARIGFARDIQKGLTEGLSDIVKEYEDPDNLDPSSQSVMLLAISLLKHLKYSCKEMMIEQQNIVHAMDPLLHKYSFAMELKAEDDSTPIDLKLTNIKPLSRSEH